MKIIQIGANKGNTPNDPIWRLCQENLPESLTWDLWFVEPNIKALELLRSSYLDAGFKDVKCIPFAVSDKFGESTLYIDNFVPGSQCSQHASLNKSHMHKMKHSSDTVTEIKVKTIALNSILSESKHVDLLQIDTEGYDGVIILGADLCKFKIKVIEFEHIHLHPKERIKVQKKLEDNGYKFCWMKREDIRYELI